RRGGPCGLSRGEWPTMPQATESATITPTPSTCQKRTSALSSARVPRPAKWNVHGGKSAKARPRTAYSPLQKPANRPSRTSCRDCSGRGMALLYHRRLQARVVSGDRLSQAPGEQDAIELGSAGARHDQIEAEGL